MLHHMITAVTAAIVPVPVNIVRREPRSMAPSRSDSNRFRSQCDATGRVRNKDMTLPAEPLRKSSLKPVMINSDH